METKVELGDQVSDPMTGFKGTAIAVTQWLHGCLRITVQPKGLDNDGKLYDVEVFDEPALKVTKAINLAPKERKLRAVNGGPRPNTGQKPAVKR